MKRRCRLCSGGDWADAGSVDPEEPHLRQALGDGLASYLRWHQTPEDGPGLFLWEAFVSGGAKTAGGENLHASDAELAVDAFLRALPDVDHTNAIRETAVHSLVGPALLRSGWTNDVKLLAEPCLVIRESQPPEFSGGSPHHRHRWSVTSPRRLQTPKYKLEFFPNTHPNIWLESPVLTGSAPHR